MPGSSKWSLSLRFPHHTPVFTSPLPHTCYVTRLSHCSRFYHLNNKWCGVQIINSSLCICLYSLSPRPSYIQIFSSAPDSQTPSTYVPPFDVSDQISHPYKEKEQL
jgi:hypothetical protein